MISGVIPVMAKTSKTRIGAVTTAFVRLIGMHTLAIEHRGISMAEEEFILSDNIGGEVFVQTFGSLT